MKSHGRYRWVRKGTRAVFHIRAAERTRAWVTFLCGTELLREGEQSLGLDACCFRDRARRFRRTVQWFDDGLDDLERKLTIAAKKAELVKLSREERPDREGLWRLFWAAFFLGGGFFAVAMVVGMALIAVSMALIFEGPGAILPLLAELPWMKLFLQTFVVVGGLLGSMLFIDWDET